MPALTQTAHGHNHDHEHDHDHEHQHAHGNDRGEGHSQGRGTPTPPDAPTKAVAQLAPTEGNEVRGTVSFTQEPGGIRVIADVSGLTPSAKHGFHIHEHGDCSAPDATSAGGHFNPKGKPHGGPDDEERHVGDLGNLEADENGVARLEFVDRHLSFSGDASIIRRSVIVHAKEDDLKSQPTGDAGPRIACGVIQAE
jgi:superoxide dismutase, Cu-Zn family